MSFTLLEHQTQDRWPLSNGDVRPDRGRSQVLAPSANAAAASGSDSRGWLDLRCAESFVSRILDSEA